MTWPADRKAVDKDGKWLDPWLGQLQKLKPLLEYTPAQFAALQQLIAAYIESQQEGDEGTDPGAIIDFALPIEADPLFSEDYLLGYSNNSKAGRRYNMTIYSRPPVLISTTAVAGAATADIAIPSGYTDLLVIAKGISVSSSGFISVGFSEDGGTTLLDQAIDIHRNGSSQAGLISAAVATWTVNTASATSTVYGRLTIYDYRSAALKFIEEIGFNYISGSSVVGWTGGRLLTNSAAAINMMRFEAAAGTLDAGTVELWGIP